MEAPEGWKPDDHQIAQNVIEAYEEAYRKRDRYRKIGPRFVILSGIAFLTLIFSLNSKIELLVLWVVTIIYTLMLMIRAEYRFHRFELLLGLTSDDEEEEEEAIE